jgi:hypothetical protein
MDLPSGLVWEIPSIYSDSLFSHGVTLKLLVLTGRNWWCLRYCGISGYPTEAGEVLWHHAIIINATYFAHLVHRQTLAPANIIHLFFVVMKARSLSFQKPPIHGFCTLHLVSGILPVLWSPPSVATVRTASWRNSAELPRVLEYPSM